MAERRQRIRLERSEELLELLASLPIDTQDESDRLRGRVLRLARAHRLSVYDAVYLDLAMDRGTGAGNARCRAAEGGSGRRRVADRDMRREFYRRMAASTAVAAGGRRCG